ncbi:MULTISPECIES: amidohydrolase [unclassified Pseudoalteromonas]|jgi:imidazolonepropionase-like amidohydrolase|uniref:amidohydrolase n=1 Tax=unclassified Pseudoalteromonas TaxID=194690 RepID=UPI0006D5D850|nr:MULTISPECIES: amidohydrolase [unclassified Pseudoalteromonas]HAG41834.1 amidohydrolase [Pseudoalteromonas sp.]KPV92811.1 D-hydantoinase [Pseudoalteromonas sp. P1-30]KPW03559.1 D-hydantoinase [Pseudoalteromonas sp. P1-11]MDC9511994.1 amidohydrolase [Pseudoalteromonas sp. CST1]MDC9536230.1 amidohydrolase [Pseudoalteromonas sp. CST3]|tara:strand:- start:59 stop:1441 length:1383 start_codon:yes stop_codon:yes gene_type:complete
MQKFAPSLLAVGLAAALVGCQENGPQDAKITINKNPYPSTYTPLASKSTLIINATVLTGTGERLDDADVLLVDGKVQQVGKDLSANADATIDAQGKWVTPGIIDVHSHLGAYPSPSVESHQDGNEMTSPNTAEVWVEHSVWPQDPGFNRAREGGITSLQILPGSANLFGGRGVTLKNIPAHTMQAMKFPDAPNGLKMACGENPKRVYGRQGTLPSTRMGNMAGYRMAWAEAQEYKRAWDKYDADYEAGLNPEAPVRDIKHDTLRAVIEGEVLIHNHCYKAEEMAMMIDLSKEFGYHAGTFHHGVEAYKIADLLAENGSCAALWPDWWGFKMEAYDMVQENVAIVDAVKNSCAIVHSDSDTTIQRLNQEAGKVMYRANENGFDISEQHAIKWITSNAAKSLGIEDKTGSLEAGKQGDVVIWNQNPFSVYAKAEQVFIDGAKVYDRNDSAFQAQSDFMLGQQ